MNKKAVGLFAGSVVIGFFGIVLASANLVGPEAGMTGEEILNFSAAAGVFYFIAFIMFVASVVVWWTGRPPKESHIHIHTNAPMPTPNIKYSDKYCPHCSSSVIEGARFCGQCGKEFT